MSPHFPGQHEIETFSGTYIDTLNPRVESVRIQDIAHHLSQINRFGGAARYPYSVAEHAVFVSRRLEATDAPRGLVYAGLHHDDTEAYLSDIPRPTKPLLGEQYGILTERMDKVICQALRGDEEQIEPWLFSGDLHHPLVKAADNFALLVEARHLLPSGGKTWGQSSADSWNLDLGLREESERDPEYWLGGLTATQAEGLFLSRHYELVCQAKDPFKPLPWTLRKPEPAKHGVVYA